MRPVVCGVGSGCPPLVCASLPPLVRLPRTHTGVDAAAPLCPALHAALRAGGDDVRARVLSAVIEIVTTGDGVRGEALAWVCALTCTLFLSFFLFSLDFILF